MQVKFDGVGGLSHHIQSLKEMVVFPLLYPEVFERFKIQPPRYVYDYCFWFVFKFASVDVLSEVDINIFVTRFPCIAEDVCFMGLQELGRRWWHELWPMNAVRVTRRCLFSCARAQTASANGWESLNDSSAYFLTRWTSSRLKILALVWSICAESLLVEHLVLQAYCLTDIDEINPLGVEILWKCGIIYPYKQVSGSVLSPAVLKC